NFIGWLLGLALLFLVAFLCRCVLSAVRINLGDCRNLTRVCIPQKVAFFSNHPVTPSKNAHFIAEFPPKV
ncbi:MAG: hypothetical protein MR679_00520, partial [Bacteroidales bacterium]|nr:hypothetical protein [Bacteroidales bacterium]